LRVVKTDNEPRVRDGYMSPSTCGHPRAQLANAERWICRRKALTDDRACTRVTLPNFHGKEGVDGSSPSEGLKSLQIGHFGCLI
jgi:hypothetical protein